MMKITEHFHSTEFNQHANHGFEAEPYPLEWIVERLTPLCETLEAIRFECGHRPIKILSGYRSAEYNRKIGGALHSQHVAGRAADIVVADMTPSAVHATILRIYRAGFLPHLGGLGEYATFTHVDVRPQTRLARWKGKRAA